MRATNDEITKLTARVEELNGDVQKLRMEFVEHVKSDDAKYGELHDSLKVIQSKVDQLLVDINEPLESYKAAKQGFSFVKSLGEISKWLAPLIVGLSLGSGVIDEDAMSKIRSQAQQTQQVQQVVKQ